MKTVAIFFAALITPISISSSMDRNTFTYKRKKKKHKVTKLKKTINNTSEFHFYSINGISWFFPEEYSIYGVQKIKAYLDNRKKHYNNLVEKHNEKYKYFHLIKSLKIEPITLNENNEYKKIIYESVINQLELVDNAIVKLETNDDNILKSELVDEAVIKLEKYICLQNKIITSLNSKFEQAIFLKYTPYGLQPIKK